MNIWHDISKERVNLEDFVVCIEISKGSKNKYELDKETGSLILDRILYTSTHYPHNYGFIPKTYAEDNDPLDVLVICSESIVPLALVKCYPIGVVHMIDNGAVDDKIIAICQHDPIYNSYKDISELPVHIFDEIEHFFNVYKTCVYNSLHLFFTQVMSCLGKEEAIKIIKKSIDSYQEKFEKK